MVDLADVVDSVYPSDGSTGVVLNDTVRIVFKTEIDEALLKAGGLIVEGPDTDQLVHTDYAISSLSDGSEEEVLNSPGFKGVVAGEVTFVRLDPVADTPVNVLDTNGHGSLYRTQLIFKPKFPFKRDTTYTVYLVGDNGIKPRTVFDGVSNPTNTGNGTVRFGGSYTGSLLNDTIHVRITKAGVAGVAEYEWWKASAPLDLHGEALTSRNSLNLIDGVTIQFLDGEFNLDDEFTVVVKKQEFYTGILTITFTTGSGTIQAVPTTTATSPLGVPAPVPVNAFYVTKVTPADGSSNLSEQEYKEIVIEFSQPIDPATVTQESVKILAKAVIDHPNLPIDSPNGEIAKKLTVSGNKLTIGL